MSEQTSLPLGDLPPLTGVKIIHVKAARPHERKLRVEKPAPVAPGDIEHERMQRDEGVTTVLAHLTKAERQSLQNIIEATADRLPSGFTADDVYEKLPPGLIEKLDNFPHAFGGAMLGCARRDKIRNTKRVQQSTRKGNRGRNVAIWEKV